MHLHLFIIALALLLSVATSAKTVQEIIEDNEVKAFAQHMYVQMLPSLGFSFLFTPLGVLVTSDAHHPREIPH